MNDVLNILPQGKSVFTNGCFDVIHAGHEYYLQRSRALGDFLIVGLNSDESVARLKGPSRPKNKWDFRSGALARLNYVDFVISFSEDTPLNLLKLIRPHIITKGGDYTIHQMIGRSFVESYNGQAVIIPFLDGYSTSALLNE